MCGRCVVGNPRVVRDPILRADLNRASSACGPLDARRTHSAVCQNLVTSLSFLAHRNFTCGADTPFGFGAGGPCFLISLSSPTKRGAPSFAFCAKGGCHERLRRRSTPLDPETKSRSNQYSRPPARLLREDRSGNCSSTIVRAIPPVVASPDCDRCISASNRSRAVLACLGKTLSSPEPLRF
jgi:hypothetical protein